MHPGHIGDVDVKRKAGVKMEQSIPDVSRHDPNLTDVTNVKTALRRCVASKNFCSYGSSSHLSCQPLSCVTRHKFLFVDNTNHAGWAQGADLCCIQGTGSHGRWAAPFSNESIFEIWAHP